MVRRAFDLGITHFDLANNYGPPPAARRATSARFCALDLKPYRDELIISSKAGYDMWPGPYGELGIAKISAGESRPEPEADGPGIRRHLLLASPRP